LGEGACLCVLLEMHFATAAAAEETRRRRKEKRKKGVGGGGGESFSSFFLSGNSNKGTAHARFTREFNVMECGMGNTLSDR